jgi:large subunit ribosomal protein L17
MFRNMVTSLFRYEQLETTDSKAKELRPIAEKMITLAKRGDLHARRQALSYIKDKGVTHRLFEELKERYSGRQGGYLRIIKKGNRRGDGAPVSVVQLLPAEQEKKTKKKGKVKGKGVKPAASTGSKKKEVKKSLEGKGSVEDKDPEKEVSAEDNESKKE